MVCIFNCEGTCETSGQKGGGCTTSCQVNAQDVCKVNYQSCTTYCERSSQCGSCESSCQSGCQSSCQTYDETCGRCERSSQCGSCESSCESTCESRCQTGAQLNSSPGTPGSIGVPVEVRAGEKINISWGASSDSNLSGYELERSIDNAGYSRIYKGTSRSYQDIAMKGWNSVRYRVRGYDPYTTGSYKTSNYITVINNSAPIISGSDLDLGAKVDDFQIEYIVTDLDGNDEVSVEIKLDNVQIQAPTNTSLGVKKFIDVNIADYSLGQHKVYIIAKDKEGLTTTRVYAFTKTNTAPEISGNDTDLGAKNSAFSLNYQVRDRDKDSVTVYEKLNGSILQTRTNVTLETDLTITVDNDMLQKLEVGKVNTIEIEAKDNKGGIAYRRYTFKRTNFAPVISGSDGDVGEAETSFSYKWSATDQEKDPIKATIYFDGKVFKAEHSIEDNAEQVLKFEKLEFFKIKPGTHTIRIVVVDDKGEKSERVVSFTRTAKRLIMQQQEVFETDVAGSRILVVPNQRVAPGAIDKVEVCNNGFDKNPTWEDATAMVKAGKAFNFQNKTKTGEKWGIDSRLTILSDKAEPLQSWIIGWGVSYE